MFDSLGGRRTFVSRLLASAGLIASGPREIDHGSTSSHAKQSPREGNLSRVEHAALPKYARVQQFTCFNSSSDFEQTKNVSLKAGATRELLNVEGPGFITQMTFAVFSGGTDHLSELMLRVFWDGNDDPSIETPLGDFFALNVGAYSTFDSPFLSCTPGNVLHCYLVMPYRKSARLTLSNDGTIDVPSCFWNIDYRAVPNLQEDALYLHTQYRNGESRLPSDGIDHKYLEASGRGHLVALTLGITRNASEWANLSERIIVDGGTTPDMIRSVSEHVVMGSCGTTSYRAGTPFAHCSSGIPTMTGMDAKQTRYSYYRWYGESPLTFRKSIQCRITPATPRVGCDGISSVAYWYQSEPAAGNSTRLPGKV